MKKILYLGVAIVLVVIGISKLTDFSSGSPLGRGVYDSPVWSPDGTHLAFIFSKNGIGQSGIWLFESRNNEFTLLENEGLILYSALAWFDDTTLCFSRTRKQNETLECIDVIDKTTTTIMNRNVLYGFAFNPDRLEVIFTRSVKYSQDHRPKLYSLDLAKHAIKNLSETFGFRGMDPVWLPDRRHWSFHWDGITVVDSVDANSYVIDAGVYSGTHQYAWSPDGQWILYIGDEKDNELGLYLLSNNNELNENPRQILSAHVSQVSWSPDGTFIAYTTVGSPGNNELQIVHSQDLGLDSFD